MAQGTGTTLTFASFTANLLDISGPGLSRDVVETTHMGTTVAKTFEPADLYDGGEVNATIEYDGSKNPPITGTSGAVVIDWSGTGAGYKSTFNGFLTAFEPQAAINERMTATLTIKVTGAVTPAAS